MDGIALISAVSFAILVVTWAFLPANSRSTDVTVEEPKGLPLTPAHES